MGADTRHYIGKLASNRVLLIYNNHPDSRTKMTVALSEDDIINGRDLTISVVSKP